MKKLALVATILIAGCSAANTYTGDTDPRLAALEAKRQTIAEGEKQCIEETLNSSRNEIGEERDREVSQCHATADDENAKIAEHERKEYELQAQEERQRASLMMILTTSQPR